MDVRCVSEIVKTQTVREGGGFKVRRPSRINSITSPFLLLDEMGPTNYGPGEAVGAHGILTEVLKRLLTFWMAG